MKIAKYLLALVFLSVFTTLSFAQGAKIMDTQGKVLIKKDAASDWQKAKLDMLLGKDAEIQTKEKSVCTLSFDAAMKNIVTIRENSHVKIENILPGKLYLPEGRVFAVIESLASEEKFQVRTPTAIAGARGTGWLTSFINNVTSALCFNDQIFVQGLDADGNPTGETNVSSGYGVEVGPAGLLGKIFALKDMDFKEWDDFMAYITELMNFFPELLDNSAFQDAIQEARDNFQQENYQDRRQLEESSSSGGSQGEERYLDSLE